MALKETIQSDIKAALKAREAAKVSALRMLFNEIRKREIDGRKDLQDSEILKVLSSLIKQRKDSIAAFRKGGREDLAEKEQAEIDTLSGYMPEPLSESEIESIVVAAIEEAGATSQRDMGKVMKICLEKAAGRADGKIINGVVRAKLTQS